jgi:hypothetical protein
MKFFSFSRQTIKKEKKKLNPNHFIILEKKREKERIILVIGNKIRFDNFKSFS